MMEGESIKIVGVKDFQNHFWIQEDQLDSVTIDAELKEIDILRADTANQTTKAAKEASVA